MTSRQNATSITTPDDLPARYPGSSDAGITPKNDWWYIQAVHYALRGGVFLDGGSLTNAEHARARLVKAGLMRDWMEGETDEQDN